MTTLQKIYKIAEATRRVCEELVYSDLSKDMDFHQQVDLSCMCACASWILRNELRRNGIYSSIIFGYFFNEDGDCLGEHYWLKYKNKYIDLTIKQFESMLVEWDYDFPDILIFNQKNKKLARLYEPISLLRKSTDLVNIYHWPETQEPSGFVLDKNVRKFIREKMKEQLT